MKIFKRLNIKSAGKNYVKKKVKKGYISNYNSGLDWAGSWINFF